MLNCAQYPIRRGLAMEGVIPVWKCTTRKSAIGMAATGKEEIVCPLKNTCMMPFH